MDIDSRRLIAYYQEVLDKISFADRATFRKELRKAFRKLLPDERLELKRWFRSACLCRPLPVGSQQVAGRDALTDRS